MAPPGRTDIREPPAPLKSHYKFANLTTLLIVGWVEQGWFELVSALFVLTVIWRIGMPSFQSFCRHVWRRLALSEFQRGILTPL